MRQIFVTTTPPLAPSFQKGGGGVPSETLLRPPIFLSSRYVKKRIDEISKLCRDSLREVVSNYRESGDRSKKSTFFLFTPKDTFGESFSKVIFKSSSEFLIWKKIRKLEIGQNVPNLRHFYWAFSAFSQRTHKTTKNYLGFIFS